MQWLSGRLLDSRSIPLKSSFLYYTYNGEQEHEGFVGLKTRMFQSNNICHPDVTKLHSLLGM